MLPIFSRNWDFNHKITTMPRRQNNSEVQCVFPQTEIQCATSCNTRVMSYFQIFRTNMRHRVLHTRVNAARIYADVAREKWRPKFPKFFVLLAHNSKRLCLLEFCLSIFVVSCPNFSEVRQCGI